MALSPQYMFILLRTPQIPRATDVSALTFWVRAKVCRWEIMGFSLSCRSC
jgi:hypothetical protein